MARKPRTPVQQAATSTPLPGDVRLMNMAANSVFALLLLGVLALVLMWLLRAPVFAIRTIQLDGELLRNSVPNIRANATPRLVGNFFSVDLLAGQRAFEAVPWVRKAELRRVWPDRLVVRLQEHRAAALWQGPNDDVDADRLVNSYGEVFDANVGEVEGDSLPTLAGPEGSAAAMLVLLQRLQPVLAAESLVIDRLHLSGRGSWRLELDTGATIELGRGSDDEVVARTARFARTLAQVTTRWKQPLESADLRHRDAYAVRLRNVGTNLSPGVGANFGKPVGKPVSKPAAAPSTTPKTTPPPAGVVKTN